MTHQHTKAKILSPKKRGTLTEPLKLTEPHYMFCGTPVEEHCAKINSARSTTSDEFVDEAD